MGVSTWIHGRNEKGRISSWIYRRTYVVCNLGVGTDYPNRHYTHTIYLDSEKSIEI